MEEHHNVSPDNWGKISTDWFTKCSDGYISFHFVQMYQFSPPLALIPAIHRIGNSPNIPFPRSREQDESHPILYSIASCLKLHQTSLED